MLDQILDKINKLDKRTTTLQILAFILLAISICFNFKEYKYMKTYFKVYEYTEIIDIKPSLLITFFSICLFGGFIIRNMNEILENNIIFIFIFLDILFFSGLISVFLDSKDSFMGFSPQALLLLGITFMWIGMRSLTGYAFGLLIILSFFHISHVNDAMGFDGCMYILFAFISFVIQMYLNIIPTARFHHFKRDFIGEKSG